jgi:single-strand DNA-binding protein
MNTIKNKVQLIGNLGNDPEIFTFDNGSKKATLSIATNDSYKNKEGKKVEDVQWHNVVFFGKTVDIVEKFLMKGSEIAIEGKLTTRSYEAKDGEKRYVTEVVASELLMLGKKA